MTERFNCIIMGAAGRDFHDFQTFFQNNPQFHVRAFTATQIPFIDARSFPKQLAGPHYEHDIPIIPEEQLPELIEEHAVDFVFLSYSDLPHEQVMHKAALVQSCGASFALLGPRHTQLRSSKPVIAVTAVRTGAGKSPLSQFLARDLTQNGHRVGVIRHPMPYGDLTRQQVERFATPDDLDRYNCTVEEREEYEPYVEQGLTIFAGVNYSAILSAAEAESDVILWDGGNNDFSFIRPDLSIVVADALRPDHETTFYPGETNFRAANVIVINKVLKAPSKNIDLIRNNITQLNPNAVVIEADLQITLDNPEQVAGKKVLVVEDGPTLTHGGMPYGAGTLAAQKHNAAELIDPRPCAVGTIADAFQIFPHMQNVLPALGYSKQQCEELSQTIHAAQPDLVVDASPARLDRLLNLTIPLVRVRYQFQQTSGPSIQELVRNHLAQLSPTGEQS